MENSIARLMSVARQIRRENLKFAGSYSVAGLITMNSSFCALPPDDQADIARAALEEQEAAHIAKSHARMIARDGFIVTRRHTDWDWHCCQRLKNPLILASLGAFVVFSKGISERSNRTGTLTALAGLAASDHHDPGESFIVTRGGTPEVRIHTAWYFKRTIGPLGRYASRENKICGLWVSLGDE